MTSGRREIHQLIHTLSYGDAISGEALSLQRCFRKFGWQSEIYAINVHPRLAGAARDFREFPANFAGDIVLHYSLGSPLNALYRDLSRARRALIYHNLTPPRWFRGVNPRVKADLEAGLRELPDLCRLTESLLADSSFNAGELEQIGFRADVLELPFDPVRWREEANRGIADLVRSEPGIHLLHVGRLAPNKCLEDVIKVFYFLRHHLEPMSKLWLVGIDIDTELYSFSLKKMAADFRLDEGIVFAGCLADSEIKALYQNATAYLCMSEHEGFCLPIIEAMSFGLPVIAYASSAVPETMGDGGILFHEKRHAEIAQLVLKVAQDASFRQVVVESGHRRVRNLSVERFEHRVMEIFADRGSKILPAGGGDGVVHDRP